MPCVARVARVTGVLSPRLLFVHAHPDDESINNGATIAHYRALGAQVVVVTCTLGEEGEVIGQQWAQLAVDAADQLGGYRIGELTEALGALGVDAPNFLGGAGHWRDSGMAGTETGRHNRFVDCGDEAVDALVAIIDELRPHVVVTYDARGGYGHPDHIRAHEITRAAVAAAQWSVKKLYWTVTSASAFAEGLAVARCSELPAEWVVDGVAELGFFYADSEITTVVRTGPDATAAKVAALRAHATQCTVAADGSACALSNNIALPITDSEHYVLALGELGPRDEHGWETDLLAGVDLDG